MAFVSSAFERKIIPLRDERGALFIRDRNYGHHQISRGRRGRSRRILPSRPDCLNGISKICWKIDSRANVRTDTQPPGHGSEPHLDFVVTDLDGMLAQLCGPGALGCGQGFRAARLQSNFAVLTSHVSARLGRSFYFEKAQVIAPARSISGGSGMLLATAWSGRHRGDGKLGPGSASGSRPG